MPEFIQIDTDAIQAKIRKTGYVSGIAAGSFLDKKTGARDAGFGLHIMDFLMGPGWRDDNYGRKPKLHGNLPKHYMEGPQICTQAKKVESEIIRSNDFVAVRMRFRFTKPGFPIGLDHRPGTEVRRILRTGTAVRPYGFRAVRHRVETVGKTNPLEIVFATQRPDSIRSASLPF